MVDTISKYKCITPIPFLKDLHIRNMWNGCTRSDFLPKVMYIGEAFLLKVPDLHMIFQTNNSFQLLNFRRKGKCNKTAAS